MPYWDDGSGQSKSQYDSSGGYDNTGNQNNNPPKTSPKSPPKKPPTTKTSPPTTKTSPPKKPKETKDNKVKSNFFESYFKYNPVARTVDKMSKSKFVTNLNAKRRQRYLENLKTTNPELYQETLNDLGKFGTDYVTRGVEFYGPESKGAGRDIETFTNLGEDQAKSILNTVRNSDDGGVGTLYNDYLNPRNTTTGGGGDNANILPYPNNVQQPEEEEVEEEVGYDYRLGYGGDAADVRRGSYNFNQGGRAGKAEGGIMELRARRAFGGIMDRVTGRKAYGLGSIFKSVKKAASKVLKSPIGKAALLYAGGVYLGGGNIFSASAYNPANFMGSKGYFANMGGGLSSLGKKFGFEKLGPNASLGDKAMKFAKLGLLGYGLTKTPLGEVKPNETSFSDRGERMKDSKGNDAVGTDIRAEIDDAYESGDPERIAAIEKYYSFLPPTKEYMPYPEFGDEGSRITVATGGRIGKAEGGLMDLGGMEKDYRAEGGFVPIGEYEKKDDVPARLSVNEFVFTADAVRGAGQGDIDKGAEIMENMMENLENGGTISKESQGKNGAQQMFETSQRLGEVI